MCFIYSHPHSHSGIDFIIILQLLRKVSRSSSVLYWGLPGKRIRRQDLDPKASLLSLFFRQNWEDPGGWDGVGGGRGDRDGEHVHPWLTHVNVCQKPLQYYKVISLQLIKINEKKINISLGTGCIFALYRESKIGIDLIMLSLSTHTSILWEHIYPVYIPSVPRVNLNTSHF